METRANYAIIGIFTMAVIAAGFLFVYWFSSSESGTKRQPIRVVFSGSVAGLSKGSAVLFNGIRVGEVNRVYFDKDQPQQAFAELEIDRDTPVRDDTKARLDVALLSGSALVSLNGGSQAAPPLQPKAGEPIPTIVAERSDLSSIIEQARGTAQKADQLLEQVTALVADNRSTVTGTLQNVKAFSDALARNAPSIDRALESIGSAAEKIGPLAAKLETLSDSVNGVVKAVDPKQVGAIVDNAAATLQNARAVSDALARNAPLIDRALGSIGTAAERIGPLATKLEALADTASGVVKAVDPKQVGEIVDNAAQMMRTVADRRPQIGAIVDNTAALMRTVADNRPQIDSILLDVASLSRRLNETAPKLDVALSSASQALTGVAGVVASVDAAKINRVIDNTDRFTQTVANSTKDVEATLRNANSITEKLNRSADRVDGVLKAAENFLGSAAGQEGQSTFSAIRSAAESVRKTADNLDKRFLEISTALSRFSGAGAKQLEAVATDARRTVNDVGRAARNLDKNPSSIIFGGGQSPLPTYGGR